MKDFIKRKIISYLENYEQHTIDFGNSFILFSFFSVVVSIMNGFGRMVFLSSLFFILIDFFITPDIKFRIDKKMSQFLFLFSLVFYLTYIAVSLFLGCFLIKKVIQILLVYIINQGWVGNKNEIFSEIKAYSESAKANKKRDEDLQNTIDRVLQNKQVIDHQQRRYPQLIVDYPPERIGGIRENRMDEYPGYNFNNLIFVDSALNEIENHFISNVEKDLKADAKKWISDNFNYSQSLMKTYLQQAFDGDGKLNKGFVINSLYIPRRSKMDVNLLKSVLISFGQKETQLSVDLIPNAEMMLNTIFKNYTDQEVANVFLRPFKLDILPKIIKNPKTVPVLNNLNEIYDTLFYREPINPTLKTIDEKEFDDIFVKLLTTRKEYEESSINFSNCVSSYFNNQTMDIVCFYKNYQPYACISLDSQLLIKEIKGFKNRTLSLSEKKEIDYILKKLK